MAIQTHVTFKSKKEKQDLARLASEAGLSLSNYFRVRAGLEPLQHGGPRRSKVTKQKEEK